MRLSTIVKFGLGIAGLAILARGYANSRLLELNLQQLFMPDLPPQFEGFRLLFVTDLHLPADGGRAALLLQAIREVNPDLLCLGGDYALNRHSLPVIDAFLHQVTSEYPTVAIWGNTDYRPDTPVDIRRQWSHELPFLTNSATCIKRDGACLWIAGTDDPHTRRDRLVKTLSAVPANAPVILLAHSPEIVNRPLDPRIRLILSGHTHGGQICLPGGYAPYHNIGLPKAYAAGWHQVGDAVLYVSRGVGSTRMPLRFNCSPEITLFTLHRTGEGENS